MAETAWVLLAKAKHAKPAKVIASARKLGFHLTPGDRTTSDKQSYEVAGGGSLLVMLVEMNPWAASISYGPTAADPRAVAAARAHLVVAAVGLRGGPSEVAMQLAALTSAIVDNVSAVGAMLGGGTVLHRPEIFSDLAALGVKDGAVASMLAIDVTASPESATRMSFLTHNLPRYGHEDFYVTCSITSSGAYGFITHMARSALSDPTRHLPTGDTLGRTESERLLVQRVPNPRDNGATVIRLDLP